MKKIVVAIDGHSSCGKSTLAKDLAAKLGYAYVDSGAMYRAVTLFFLENDIDIKDADAVDQALTQIKIHFERINNANHTFLNGEDVEKEIRTMRVSEFVSPVSTISAVRRFLVKQQQALGEQKGIVMDGRDIGTVVFPKAELKIFLTSNIEERTRRRYEELIAKGIKEDLQLVQKNLEERDHIDSTRADSPLTQAKGAILLDNTFLSREDQLNVALELAKRIIGE